MIDPPFCLLSCSWPRPVQHADGNWLSEPEWDAPLMPVQIQPRWQTIHGELCWTMDWRELFSGGLKFWVPRCSGEMRGFHVVFCLRIRHSGTLIFWDDDGCLIRRRGQLVHADRSAHGAARSEIRVCAGDRLQVAQWQHDGEWMWGARVAPVRADKSQTAADAFRPYLNAVEHRLREPDGPPLKMYFSGASPLRTVLSLYSMIINGYRPSSVLVFGDYQWPAASRELFEALLPFANIIGVEEVLQRIDSIGGSSLRSMALQHWYVMKICVGLLCPPAEFCFMDDDVFVLARIDEALSAFQMSNLVFAPDADYAAEYLAAWGWMCRKAMSGWHQRRLACVHATARRTSWLCWLWPRKDGPHERTPDQRTIDSIPIWPARMADWQRRGGGAGGRRVGAALAT